MLDRQANADKNKRRTTSEEKIAFGLWFRDLPHDSPFLNLSAAKLAEHWENESGVAIAPPAVKKIGHQFRPGHRFKFERGLNPKQEIRMLRSLCLEMAVVVKACGERCRVNTTELNRLAEEILTRRDFERDD